MLTPSLDVVKRFDANLPQDMKNNPQILTTLFVVLPDECRQELPPSISNKNFVEYIASFNPEDEDLPRFYVSIANTFIKSLDALRDRELNQMSSILLQNDR